VEETGLTVSAVLGPCPEIVLQLTLILGIAFLVSTRKELSISLLTLNVCHAISNIAIFAEKDGN